MPRIKALVPLINFCYWKKINQKSGENKAKSHLIQRISMVIQQGTATCLMSAISPEKELEDIFVYIYNICIYTRYFI